MTDTWSPWLESGEVMVFSIDTIDQETWSDTDGDPYWRIRRYEQWLQYITDEMVPFMREMVNERNGWSGLSGDHGVWMQSWCDACGKSVFQKTGSV